MIYNLIIVLILIVLILMELDNIIIKANVYKRQFVNYITDNRITILEQNAKKPVVVVPGSISTLGLADWNNSYDPIASEKNYKPFHEQVQMNGPPSSHYTRVLKQYAPNTMGAITVPCIKTKTLSINSVDRPSSEETEKIASDVKKIEESRYPKTEELKVEVAAVKVEALKVEEVDLIDVKA